MKLDLLKSFLQQILARMTSFYLKSEKILGNMKFAVSIITIFAIALIIGTFQESYHGADYANRLIYKSYWFMGLQVLMFLSILVATVVRLPFKKPLYGFYTIHAGLLTIFVGSFVTYIVGIDGSVELLPNTPSNKIIVNKSYLKINLMDQNKAIKFPLPYSASPVAMKGNYQDFIKPTHYIPFAKLETHWKPSQMENSLNDQGSTYLIFNDNVSQKFTLSLNPNSDFKSTQQLGPLNIHYMPKNLYHCFTKPSSSGFLIWNTENGECFTAEEKKLPIGKTKEGNKFVLVKYKNAFIKFFPDYSPLGVNDDLSKNQEVPYRVFSRNLFTEKPHLFIFGDKIAFYQKRKKVWIGKDFYEQKTMALPWMQFKLRLIEHHERKTPFQVPVATKPIQDKGQIVEGDIQAVKVDVLGKNYWVRTDAPLIISNGVSQIRFSIGPQEIPLPFQMTLKNFKMDKNPGTNTPASYESFISLFDTRKQGISNDHHVYMNNPLKYDDFTFYQSSYFPVGPETFASVFSANFDPGRPLKYFGSLLLVFGSIWHFILRRKKKKIKQKEQYA